MAPQRFFWITYYMKRSKPTNPGRTRLDLAGFPQRRGAGVITSAKPKRMCSPGNAHQEPAAKPKNDLKSALKNQIRAGFRDHFRGRIPDPFSGPDSGPVFGTGFRPPNIIHIVGRNPAPESGPESGPQNGTAFGAI